jgi:hypothetical protein
MGRKPWTDRLSVEQCHQLSISELLRAGVFQVELGTWSTCRWLDRDGKQVRVAVLRLLRGDDGGLVLRFQQSVVRSVSGSPMPYEQTVRTSVTRCNYGGWRLWIHCPKLTSGVTCGRRVRNLYLLPGGVELGCRSCFGLTYWSCQSHDARLDRILRLPIEQFDKMLKDDVRVLGTLSTRIGALLSRRIARKIARRRLRDKRTRPRLDLGVRKQAWDATLVPRRPE